MFWFISGNFLFSFFFFFDIIIEIVFYIKSARSPFPAKFACFNLAVKYSDVNLLNSDIFMELIK